MRRTIIALLSATLVSLPIFSATAQDLRFELQQALNANDYQRAIEIADRMIQLYPNEAQDLQKFKTQLQDRLLGIPASSTISTINPSQWKNARLLRTLQARGYVFAAAFSRDGNTLIAGGDKTLEIWNLLSGESKFLLDWVPKKSRYVINSIAISPNGENFVTGSEGRASQIRNDSDNCTSSITLDNTGFPNPSINCSWTFGDTSRDLGAAVQLWDIKTGKQLQNLEITERYSAFGYNLLNYSSDGQTLLAADNANGIIWNSSNWERSSFFQIPENQQNRCPRSSAISSDSQIITILDESGVKIQNLTTKTIERLLPFNSLVTDNSADSLIGLTFPLFGSTAISHNRQIVAASTEDFLFIWQLSTGKLLHKITISTASNLQNKNQFKESEEVFEKFCRPIAFSPNSRILAMRTEKGSITLWNLQNGEKLKTLIGHPEGNQSSSYVVRTNPSFITFSPDGRTLISTGTNGKIKFWGVE